MEALEGEGLEVIKKPKIIMCKTLYVCFYMSINLHIAQKCR